MKKFKFLGIALFAAALTVGFVSCGNDEDSPLSIDTPKNETPIEDALKLPVGSIKGTDDEATVTTVITAKDADCPIKEFLLIKGGKKVIARPSSALKKSASRAYTPTVVLEGTYRTDGTMIYISIPGYDKEFSVDSKDVLTSIIFGDTGFGAEIKELPEPTEILDQSICRVWKSPTYQAVVMFDKLCAFNKTNTSFLTLQNEMLSDLNKKDVKLDLLKDEIKGMKFFINGTAHVIYANNDVEVVTWEWQDKAKGIMSTTLNGNKVTVDVRFKEGNPNEATFVISGDFSALGSGGVHTITGRLIVTMKN